MKAVVYHAESRIATRFQPGTYERLMRGLQINCDKFGVPLIHITTRGHPIWARDGREYDGNPSDTVWNRDKFFIEFLTTEPDDVYMMIEPDHRIAANVPPLEGDLAILYRRGSGPHYTPSWRMATKAAIPILEWIMTLYPPDGSKRDWDGDSTAWGTAWERLGRRTNLDKFVFMGRTIEVRNYDGYTHPDSRVLRQWKAMGKEALLRNESGLVTSS